MSKFYYNRNDGKYYTFNLGEDGDYWIGIKDKLNDEKTNWISYSINGDDRFYGFVKKYNDAVGGVINQTWGLDKKLGKYSVPYTGTYTDLYYDPDNPTKYAYTKNGDDIYIVSPRLFGTSYNKISTTDKEYNNSLKKYNAAKQYAEAHNGSVNYIVKYPESTSSPATTATSNNNTASDIKPVNTGSATTKAVNAKKSVPQKTVTPVFNTEGQYLILYGDTLGKLAKQYNTTVDLLKTWNPDIKDVNKIYAGKYLNVNGPYETHIAELTKKELSFNEEENAKAKKALDAADKEHDYQNLASSNSYLHHTLDNYFKLYINFSENGSALPHRKILRRTK